MKAISGVLTPTRGRVTFRGEDVAGRSAEALVRRGIVHVPEGREVFPLLTVDENLSMGAFTRRDHGGIAADREAAFAAFPILAERRDQQAGTLSGGQQQMLAIARALMARPSLILLDEPSLGLSPRLVTEILGIVRDLNRERGTTILLVEQNARAALEMADHGYVLELGRIVMDGPAARLMASDDIRDFYLGGAGAIDPGRRWKRKKTWR